LAVGIEDSREQGDGTCQLARVDHHFVGVARPVALRLDRDQVVPCLRHTAMAGVANAKDAVCAGLVDDHHMLPADGQDTQKPHRDLVITLRPDLGQWGMDRREGQDRAGHEQERCRTLDERPDIFGGGGQARAQDDLAHGAHPRAGNGGRIE
jgi:hypothetical protein